MAVVVNKFNEKIFISELNKWIPGDGKTYTIPQRIADIYSRNLYILPDCVVDDIEEMKRKVTIDRKVVDTEKELLKTEKTRLQKICDIKKKLEREKNDKEWEETKNKRLKKLDFLYPFHFNGKNKDSALERFRYSLKSIIKQHVNVCVSNTSKDCIYKDIKDLGKIKYTHIPLNLEVYNKPKTINLGVRELVTTSYFYLSDIDLIYSPGFVKLISEYYYYPVPVRVVFNNYNLGTCKYFTDFKKYKYSLKRKKDSERSSKGIAPGNGLIHLESFFKINGYDEEYIGYGLEDADFNLRISYLNKYLELDSEQVNTYHLYHKISDFNDQTSQNKIKYALKKQQLLMKLGDDFLNIFEEDKHLNLLKANIEQ